jgi:hypothetical protein
MKIPSTYQHAPADLKAAPAQKRLDEFCKALEYNRFSEIEQSGMQYSGRPPHELIYPA